jgi:hypothetical protein
MSDPYLTPERFRTAGTGIDLSEVETVALRSAISRATAKINSYCAVPVIPQQYSFRGGSIVGEEHIYPTDEWERPRPFRLWPWHSPVRTVEALRLVWGVQGGSETFLDIDPDNLLISDQGYVEVSSLNLTQLVFGDAVMPYIGLHQPVFRTSYSYGYRFVSTDEYIEPVDGRTYQAQNQFWTADTVTVKVDGVEVTTGFTLDRREGWVVFDAMQDPDAAITASYTYTMPNDIQQACVLLVARDIAESDLRAKGMEGLVSIRVKDVELRRAVAAKSTGTSGSAADMPADAASYLSGHVFVTAR